MKELNHPESASGSSLEKVNNIISHGTREGSSKYPIKYWILRGINGRKFDETRWRVYGFENLEKLGNELYVPK